MVFADLADRKEIWKQGLEDWNVKQSTVANEWRTEGIAVGLTKGDQKAILNLLQIRFHSKPPEIVERVMATQDADRLSRWFELAATEASLEDFQAAMDE